MNDKAIIHVYRRKFGWESDIWRGDENLGGCTAPTMAGVFDIAYDIVAEHDPEWADFNANEDL